MDLIQLISELSNKVWEKEPYIDYDDNGEETTIWEQSSLIGPINSKGARVTITPILNLSQAGRSKVLHLSLRITKICKIVNSKTYYS